MNEKINEGDIVQVDFNNAQCSLGKLKVLYMPQATGDSWHFKNETTGEIVYVSEGCTITKPFKAS